jgi:hypothetical protein
MVDNALIASIQALLDITYPETWDTGWLMIPLPEEELNVHVICSDIPSIRESTTWPHTSRHQNFWLRWEPTPGGGFWIRPRRKNPILRDRLNLVSPKNVIPESQRETMSCQSLHHVCCFAALSNRMVWHNPPKGGAKAPDVAHFQSIPVHWEEDGKQRYTFPCCERPHPMTSLKTTRGVRAQLLGPDLGCGPYPIRGLVVEGPIDPVAASVWGIIWQYDEARACNLVIQPLLESGLPDNIRLFVFPRHRTVNNFLVTESLLREDEMDLLLNNWGGKREEWAFAGVEMGLLTQVEWEPLFRDMIANRQKWGATLLRLLQELTLKKDDEDWMEFMNLCRYTGLIGKAI